MEKKDQAMELKVMASKGLKEERLKGKPYAFPYIRGSTVGCEVSLL
jgi:predicted aconitase with swiveling domain